MKNLFIIVTLLIIIINSSSNLYAYEFPLAGNYSLDIPEDFTKRENGMYMDKNDLCGISYAASPRLSKSEDLETVGRRTKSSFWNTNHIGIENISENQSYVIEMHHGDDSGFTYIILSENYIHMICIAFKNNSIYNKKFCDDIIGSLKKH